MLFYSKRTFLGEPSERDRNLFEHMMKAKEITFSMVKPGTRCEDIDLATQDYFKSLDYGDACIIAQDTALVSGITKRHGSVLVEIMCWRKTWSSV